ncbi:MAG: hypothetical protein PVSMB1_10860 [Gemmatimonadaceae bacterium]
MYGPAAALERIAARFPYIFDDRFVAPAGTSKPQGSAHPIAPDTVVAIGGLSVVPVEVPHGPVTVFAYRIGPLAYVTDAKFVPAAAMRTLAGAKVLVINALFRTSHPTHLSLPEAIRLAGELGAERTYLTHLTHDNFHADLEAELPRGVAPAFDGLTVKIDC